MKVTSATDAFLYVASLWNEIAELTGMTVDQARRDIGVLIDQINVPSGWQFFFWGAISWINWGLDQYQILKEILAVLNDALSKWAAGTREIVVNAANEPLAMPKHLSSTVMRSDDAARYVIRELVGIAASIEAKSSEDVKRTILEVANVSAFDPLDPDDRPETLPTAGQRLWAGLVNLLVKAALLVIPFAIGYVAAIWYLDIWAKPKTALPTLAQDSKRVSGKKVSTRHRVNLRQGPDKG